MIVIATPIFAVVIVPLGIFYFLVQVRVCKGEWVLLRVCKGEWVQVRVYKGEWVQVRVCKGEWVQVRVCKGEWGFIEGGKRDRGKGRWKMGMLDISRNLWMIEKTN